MQLLPLFALFAAFASADPFTVSPNNTIGFCSPTATCTGVTFSVDNLTAPAAAVFLFTQSEFQTFQAAVNAPTPSQLNLTFYTNYTCVGTAQTGIVECNKTAPLGSLHSEVNCLAIWNKNPEAINGTVAIQWNDAAAQNPVQSAAASESTVGMAVVVVLAGSIGSLFYAY